MYYKEFISPYGAKNVEKDGKVIGFQFEINYPTIFCTPLSFYENALISVDGEKLDYDDLLISVDRQKFYSVHDLSEYINVWWPFGERGMLRVIKSGGLESGCHQIEVELNAFGDSPMVTTKGIRKLTFV